MILNQEVSQTTKRAKKINAMETLLIAVSTKRTRNAKRNVETTNKIQRNINIRINVQTNLSHTNHTLV